MSKATPYTITVRDPSTPGAEPGEHEVAFTSGSEKLSNTTVIRLTTEELQELGIAVLDRLGVPMMAVIETLSRPA